VFGKEGANPPEGFPTLSVGVRPLREKIVGSMKPLTASNYAVIGIYMYDRRSSIHQDAEASERGS
jgi:dTDP-glucose pyrophosphorylase